MWATLVFGGTIALYGLMAGSALFHLHWTKRLPSLATLEPTPATADEKPLRCSVVIAARDEADRIENTVRRLLVQHGVGLEIIVVDDRSTDGTGEIVQRLAAEDPRVRLIRVDVLPDGWLGKCHACHVGARAATGDWILFTDADCWLKPDTIRRAWKVAIREQADHVTLTPGVVPETVGASAWHLAFLLSLAEWVSGVNRDKAKSYLGIGAFNFVRADAYRECGGYEALRLTVVDDIKLGLLLRRIGKRTRGFIGGDDAECHWGTTLSGMVKIMEKNYFAAMDYNTVGLVLIAPLMIGLGCALIAGWLSGTLLGMAAGLSPCLLMIPAGIAAHRLGWSFAGVALTPFIYPVLVYALVKSGWVTLRQGGIRWRDTFYPLDVLRKGNVQVRAKR